MNFRLKKVLFVATVDSHIRHFHIPYLKYFKENGYEVHVATANDENEKFEFCDKKHTITFERSPFKINNLKAIKQMKKLLAEEKYDLVHCHTPMGGVVTRLAAKQARKEGTKIFYTAHGFHFYKGAPLVNWLIYYPIEKWLSKYTDVLITINEEDYNYSKKFKAKRVEKIDGIGVEAQKFTIELSEKEKDELRREFNIENKDVVLTYVAELNTDKNQPMLIEAVEETLKRNSNIKLLLVGKGKLEEEYKKIIKEKNLENNVILTGYRTDVNKIFKITDVAVSTSIREGLGLNMIEALLSDVPVAASKVRGHLEIVEDGVNGLLFETKEELIEVLSKMIDDKNLRNKLKSNASKSVQRFVLENSLKKGISIYESELR